MELDEELRAGLEAGTPDWGAIYRSHREVMWRSAARVLGPDSRSTLGTSAEVIVQDTMVRLMEKTERTGISAIPPDVESIEAFMRTATRNLALNVVRRAKQIAMGSLPEAGDPDERGEEEDLEQVDDYIILKQMDGHLDMLNEKELAAYTGYFKQRRTQAEIAAALGVTDRWVAKLCASAIRKLTAAAGVRTQQEQEKGGDYA
jgi:RNA polymerase sigma factor (sigma-70 family)